MWNPQTGDEPFKAMMTEFAATYANRPASTEDFKAAVEKHLPSYMDFAGNGKLDWFFDEYVYGTALPDYRMEYSFSKQGNGDLVLNLKISQSKVTDNFRMLVPLYLELNGGKVVRLGSMPLVGNVVKEQAIPLTGLKEKPKRAMLNYYNDVLCTVSGN
jgi:aminopeptidase N